MKFLVIQSGSKGNATLVYNESCVLLVDMGISYCALENALHSINKKVIDIDAMLLTHSHVDHTKGIKYLPPIPIYTGEGSYDGDNVNYVKPYQKFNINDFEIFTLSASHDAPNPLGFIINDNNETLVYFTDTGYVKERNKKYIKNADYYIFESNHNVEMEYASKRPFPLVERVIGNKGHLSNEQSANILANMVGDKTKQIILAHLSEDCNSEEIALSTYKHIFNIHEVSLDNIDLRCARQNESIKGGAL